MMTATNISALIVDDELSARENLSGILRKHCTNIDLVGEASNINDALQLIEKHNPELLLLDIKLSNTTSFELLERLDRKNFGVIFITAYDSYAIKAIKFSAVDYLLKPIDYRELKMAVSQYTNRSKIERKVLQLEILIENLSNDRAFQRLGINLYGKTEIVMINEIVRLQAESNYTRLYFKKHESILVSKTLVEFEDLLNDLGFLRVHKTHMVNTAYVKSIRKQSDWAIVLSENVTIPVSRRRRKMVTEAFTQRSGLHKL